jgi:hypothetical protein
MPEGSDKPVEGLLTYAVLTRLDSPHLAEALAGEVGVDADVAALSAQLDADTARLEASTRTRPG